jgi:hypothetical protein
MFEMSDHSFKARSYIDSDSAAYPSPPRDFESIRSVSNSCNIGDSMIQSRTPDE